MTEKRANVGEFKKNLSSYLASVERGDSIEVCRRNVPIARLVGIESESSRNGTQLGCAEGSVTYHAEPLLPIEDWEMMASDAT